MIKSDMKKTRDFATCWIFLGIPVISIIGTVMHFIYDWSGNLIIVGIFSPVNESVWEHLKLAYWPTLFWWVLGLYILNKRGKQSNSQWFCSCVIALLVGPLFIVSFYYTYTGAFGIHSLFLDILSFFLGITIAQLSALHFFRYANTNIGCLYCAGAVIILLMGAFLFFTFAPPHIPLFLDTPTGEYGI